jgi:hypothetical protein
MQLPRLLALLPLFAGCVFTASISLQLPLIGAYQAPLIIQQNSEIIPNEFIVVLRSDTQQKVDLTIDQLMAAEQIAPTQLLHRYSIGFAVQLNAGQLEALRSHPEVEYIEPNQVVYALRSTEEQVNPPSWGLPRIHQREFRSRNVYKYPATGGENVDV